MNTNRKLHASQLRESQVRARALAILRTARGLKQREVAELAGITPTQLSRYEKAAFSPRAETLERVMEALELPVAAFLEAQQLVRTLDRQSRSASPETDYPAPRGRASFINEQRLEEGASELELLESDRLARDVGRRIAELVLYLVDRRL
ncbi:MAG TPA: helix-turn-helix transcriptional regulator [Thermoanaerobaculia bacterium]|nr:helix-turn-helix transcriptional regulator [Thermoanaerobaculia bacterium]